MCTSTQAFQTQPEWLQASFAAARQGDRDAFTALVSPHTPRLQRLARRLTRSAADAEDICQESLLKAFIKLDQLDDIEIEGNRFGAWLMRITANCAIDFLRRKKRVTHTSLDECDSASTRFHETRVGGWGGNPEASYSRQEQLRIVADAISDLPAELGNVCLLRTMMELSTKEVAARLGISTIAVRLRLFRAFGQLRRTLAREDVHRRMARCERLIH